LERLRGVYTRRRNVMLNVLKTAMPSTVKWHKPTHGMFIWVELPNHLDSADVLKHSLQEERIAFLPGKPFDVSSNNFKQFGLRLNFTQNDEKQIENGIKRLASVVKSQLSK
jgi:DNA-binding transcriptional MocR family regulator